MKSLIAIPCFNHNDYLPELINKINSYVDIDILVIDDGSQDIVSKQIILMLYHIYNIHIKLPVYSPILY